MSTLSIAPAFDASDRLRVVPPVRALRPGAVREARAPWSREEREVQRRANAPRTALRLTRRGRLTVFLGTLAVALTVSFFLGAGAVGTEEAGTPVPTEVVMVGTGDTLWGIASEVAGDDSIREVMTEIERLNALESPALMAGQELRVPAAE